MEKTLRNKLLKKLSATFFAVMLCINSVPVLAYAEEPEVPHEHDWVLADTVEATCTEPSNDLYECTGCDATETRHDTPALGHSYSVNNIVDPTCEHGGYTVMKCDICDDIYNTDFVDEIDHDYQPVDVVEPSCTVDGATIYECTMCHDGYSTPIPKSSHFYDWELDYGPTYTTPGREVYKCSICGDEADERAIPVLEHEHEYADEAVVTAPTCQTPGVGSHRCTICEQTFNYEIPVVDHSFGEEYVVDTLATCQEVGQRSKHCIWCGAIDETSIAEIGLADHAYSDEYTVDVAPTCTTPGSKSRHCTTDGCDAKTDVTEIPATHSYESEVTAPTCTTDGFTTYTCTVCGNSYVGDTVEALGHEGILGEPTDEVPATCTESGSYTENTICSRCGITLSSRTVELPAPGHTDSVRNVTVTEPSCTNPGSHLEIHECGECGLELGRETVTDEALGHAVEGVEWTVTLEPTCATTGTKVKLCAVCGEVAETETIPVNPDAHDFVEGTNYEVTPTCEESGIRIDLCSRCDARTYIEVPALGHDYVAEITKQPTYDEAGVKTFTCSRCDDTYTETIAKLVRPVTPSPAPTPEPTPEPTPAPETTPAAKVTDTTKSRTSEAKYIEIRPSMKTEIFGNVMQMLKSKDLEAVTLDDVLPIPREIFEIARDNDKIIKVDGGKYAWEINGASITGNVPELIDLRVTDGSALIGPVDIEKVAGANPHKEFSIAHNGDFGLEAKLSLAVDPELEGKRAKLHYFNPIKMEFESIGECPVKHASVSFDFTHASDYMIVFEDEEEPVVETVDVVTNDEKVEEPVVKETEPEKVEPVPVLTVESLVADEPEKESTVSVALIAGITSAVVVLVLVLLFAFKKRR